ncbi:DUF1835 domain-containing protein [Cytobacillus dafuensis]|uniref:DUF1835 domain-containing protein n=2 Tax=Cytobacillus dafuensis TaxID=1742359 RepID=A0A5B8ZAG7_CYTDA|nr:DUF1835 domain-containing protein [Cytobacillus dafuensis]
MEIDQLKKAIEELPEGEVKSLLFHILLRVNHIEEKEYSETEFVDDVKRVYKTLLDITKERSESKQADTCQMIHILFGGSPAGSLKVALKEMGVFEKEKVYSFWNIFSVGPIWQLHEEIGIGARFTWMKESLKDKHEELREYLQRFHQTVHQILSIPKDVPITLWTAENAHEQTGLRFVLHLLKDKPNEIKVINTSLAYAEHFNRADIKYTVLHSGEIPPEKLQTIYEHSKQKHSLSNLEREQYEQEWLHLSDNRESLRIWRNGRIQSVCIDYYDQYIINLAKKLQRERESEEFMKSARLIGEALGHLDQYIGDEFLEYRVRKLIENGVFEMEGNLKAMRYYGVKLS